MEQTVQSSAEAVPEKFWEWYGLSALFGDTPQARVLQFLSIHCTTDYTLKEIARQTHVGYRTFYRFIRALISLSVIQVSRTIGATKLYQLNEESPIVKLLRQLNLEVSMKAAERQHAEEKLVAVAGNS